ncbi:hypothetical protein MKW98_009470 [Papaver atlanticum]|uniref:4-coumarate--CoA ligase n=1 Tax=Papaver atlanticum TaxID=357466 RepID=A0AAD4SGE3_9MAGN|nr:hypothetical protein MKW98_009470 [Papaver atlanticum]
MTSVIDSHETIVFRSKLPDISISNNIPLHKYCFENISEYNDKPCLITGSNGRIYSYHETHLLCQKTAAGLSKLGVKKGDVIILLLQNCPEFVFSFLGASMLGAVSATPNPAYFGPEIYKQIDHSKIKLIITESQYVQKVRDIEKCVLIATIDDPPQNCMHFSGISNADETEIAPVTWEPENPVSFPYSSGTTGFPKGVILTHKSIISNVAQLVDGENPNLYLESNDVVLCALPLFHMFAMLFSLCSLRAGAGILILQNFEIGSFLKLIQKYRVSVAPIVPPIVVELAKNPMAGSSEFSSIRAFLSGGAPLGKQLHEELKRKVPQAIVGQAYGMSEGGPALAVSLVFAKQPLPSKFGSSGHIVRNAEMKIIDPVTGSRYLNDGTMNTIDQEGWLHTGDIGYIDNDDEIFIVDRVTELISFREFKIAPAELEALLLSHPSIDAAAVVSQDDPAAGEAVVAFVVQSDGAELTEDEVKEFVAKQVEVYKRPHKIFFIDAIPVSPTGKILRKELRAKLASSSA